jgi:hypothetical protein
MKVRSLLIICLLLLLGACRQGDVINQIPSDVLTREQMIPLLVDIHLTEASLKLNQSNIKPGEIKLYYSSAYTPIFKKHKTSPKQFEQSIQWYTKHIDQLDEIYTEVITRLSKLETQLKSKPKVTPAKKITKPVVPTKNISHQDSVVKNTKQTTPAKNVIKFVKPKKK